MDPSHTVVIGAGIAGLTVASGLETAGQHVTVLERSDTVGGAIRTVRVDGYRIEEGPNSLLDTSPEVAALLERIGLAEKRVFAREEAATRYVVRNGRPVALPMSPGQFFSTSLFGWGAKLRLFREPFISPWDNRHEETVADFVRRRLGHEFLDYAINPFVGGVYAGDPTRLSVEHAFPKLYALEQKYGGLIKGQVKGARERKKRAETSKQKARMYSFPEGLGMLPATLAASLQGQLHTGATVVEVSQATDMWKVVYRDPEEALHVVQADSIVYTGRLSDLSRIDFVLPENALVPAPPAVIYPPVTVLGLGFPAAAVSHPLDGFGMLVPEVEGRHILGALFSSTLFPGCAPKGQVLLTVFVGGTRQPELALLPSEDLLPRVMRDLRDLLGVAVEPVMLHRRTWPHAIPQYNIGYGQVKAHLDALEADHPGLYFAGNYRSGISVPDTIKSSLELVPRIHRFLQGSMIS